MTRNCIYDDVQRLRKKYGTNDPFELLDAIHAQVVFSDAYPKDGLKGYCAVLLKQKYVVINSKLIQCEKRVVGSHELGHLIVHGDELKTGAAFKDHDIYQATGRKEREANFFAADFLIDDSDVLDAMHSCGADFFSVASSLYIPAPFFAFKLYSMVERGFAVRVPVDLDSTFLAK